MTNKKKLKEVIMKTFGLTKYDVDLTYLKGCEILRCKAEDLCQHCGNMDFLDKEFVERTLNAPEKVQNEIRDKNIMKLVAAQGDNERRGNMDVLDKIRERIELEKLGYTPSSGYYKAIIKCLQIIDMYTEESEDKE